MKTLNSKTSKQRGAFKVLHYPDQNLIEYYSYYTLIVFKKDGDLHICNNEWSVTTAKHLNYIDSDIHKRISHSELMRRFNAMNSMLEKTNS